VDVQRGLELTDALLSAEPRDVREIMYLQSVARYRLKDYVEARSILQKLLDMYPEFRQAESLLEHVEAGLVKEGLVGVGIGAALLGVGAVAVSALLSSSHRSRR